MKLSYKNILQTVSKYIFRHKKIFNSSNENSILSISVLSILALFIAMTIYAAGVFFQFSLFQIIFLAFVFLGITTLLCFIFLPKTFRNKISLNLTTISYSLLTTFILLLFTVIPEASWIKKYIHHFPLFDIENGLGWYRDTVFHVSIIQSIMHQGYPSIGQHDTPLIIYHVLSHYVDAFILLITRLEPFDSYGLLFHFKIFTLFSATILFIGNTFKKVAPYTFFAIIITFIPIIISTWHLIGSHGLWFVSILLIFSTKKTYRIITNDSLLTKKNMFFLLIMGIIITLGKISSGFAFMVFIGIVVFIKNYKNKYTYILGGIWLIFLFAYQKMMLSTNVEDIKANIQTSDWNKISFFKILESIQDISKIHYHLIVSSFTTVIMFAILAYIFKKWNNIVLFLASLFSFFVVVFITELRVDFSVSDVWYFFFGLNFILLIYFIPTLHSIIIKTFKNINYKEISKVRFNKITLFVAMVGIGTFYQQPEFNILNLSYETICLNLEAMNQDPFKTYNNRFKTKYSVKRIITGKESCNYPKHRRMLFEFRNKLNNYIEENNLSVNDVVLYIPKETYEQQLGKLNGDSKSLGMLFYSFTGVPLVYGIQGNIRGYGHATYTKEKHWLPEASFNPTNTFKSISKNHIIKITDIINGEFTLFKN